MNRMVDAPIEDIVAMYESGSTIMEISEKYSIGDTTILLWLRKLGIKRRSRGVPKGYKFSEEHNRNVAEGHRGLKRTAEQRKHISDARKCDYNGMNGYGHTKQDSRGYILAYCPMHPKAHADGYVLLHRVIMERHIGRYLNNNEVAHHINHIRSDNRIENLRLMDKKEHQSMHMKERYQQRRNMVCASAN